MTFWTNRQLADPIMSRSFRVRAGSGENAVWWWAKSVTKPSLDINTNDYLLGNVNFSIPGVALWNDVTITFVEVGNKVKEVYESLFKSGYGFPSKVSNGRIFKVPELSNNLIRYPAPESFHPVRSIFFFEF